MKINLEKLESLLVKNWTEFISYKTLFPIIKENVNSLLNSMPKIIEKTNNIIPNRASMSRFYLKNDSYMVWFDYVVSLNEKEYASGTIEFKIIPDGSMVFSDLEGTLHVKQH
jgi:hypothetical protein